MSISLATLQPSLGRLWAGRFTPATVYTVVALVVLGPALGPGYLLTLDMVFAPEMSAETQFYGLNPSAWASLPYLLVLQGLAELFPAWVVQKALLFLALFLAGLGAHKLAPVDGIPRYYAGLLFMVNPFVHLRLLAGQWTLLLSYALLPFAVMAFMELMQRGGWRPAFKLVLVWTVAGAFQLHSFPLFSLVFLVLAVAHWGQGGFRRKALASLIRRLGPAAVMMVVLNIYWLVPIFFQGTSRIHQIGPEAMRLFAPLGMTDLHVGFEVAAMEGFWRAASLLPVGFSLLWYVPPFVVVFYLAILGLLGALQDRATRWTTGALGVIALAGLVLALGASTVMTDWLFRLLWDHVPFFKGFRDSHKFVALLVLGYAYLGAFGVRNVQVAAGRWPERLRGLFGPSTRRFLGNIVLVLPLLVPLAYTIRAFDFSGQVNPTSYPAGWEAVKQTIANDDQRGNVLVLPWHQYLDITWLPQPQQRVSNPAKLFFPGPVISGDNIGSLSIYSESTDSVSGYVEFLLANRDTITNFGELMAPINVRYVVLLHEVEFEQYGFLHSQDDLEVALSTREATLFRNTHPVARAYGVDRVTPVSGLSEFLELSRTQEVMEHIYLLGPGQPSGDPAGIQAIQPVNEGSVSILLGTVTTRYVVFTNSQHISPDNWELNEDPPVLRNLGFIPVFEVASEDNSIHYTLFNNRYRWGYIISLMGLVMALFVLRRRAAPPAV
jgi:hypothetical protein